MISSYECAYIGLLNDPASGLSFNVNIHPSQACGLFNFIKPIGECSPKLTILSNYMKTSQVRDGPHMEFR